MCHVSTGPQSHLNMSTYAVKTESLCGTFRKGVILGNPGSLRPGLDKGFCSWLSIHSLFFTILLVKKVSPQ